MAKNEVAYTIRARDGYLSAHKKANAAIAQTAKQVKTASLVMAGSFGFVTASLFAMSKATAESGDEFQKMSARLDISAQTLSEMKHAVELSGGSIADYEKGLKKLSKSALDADRGLLTYKRSFDELGISVRDSNDQLKDSDTLFLEVADGLKNMENSTRKTALAQELLGRSGVTLMPLMKAGAEGIREMRQEANDLGIAFSDFEADESAAFVDGMLRVKGTITGTRNALTKELIPSITIAMDSFAEGFIDLKKSGDLDIWAADMAEGVITSFVEMAKFGTQLPIAWQSIIIASKEVSSEVIGVFSAALLPLEKIYDVLEELPGDLGLPYRQAKADIIALREGIDATATGMALSTEENKKSAEEWAVWSGEALSAIDAVRNRALEGGPIAGVGQPAGPEETGATSVLSPEESPEAVAIKTRMQFRDEELTQLQTIEEVRLFFHERNMVMRENEEAHVIAANFRMGESAKARSRVTAGANQAMQNQMLALIETHKFSTSALARAVSQQVKIELVGIAAKASVRALYEVGLGLATSFTNPPESATHFAAASQLALIGAASIAGAAAVNVATGGGTAGGAPLQTQPTDSSLLASDTREEPGRVVNITLNMSGVVSPDTMPEMMEKHIKPAMEEFSEREGTFNITVKNSEEARVALG